MLSPKMNERLVALIVVTLAGVIGLLTWLTPASRLKASANGTGLLTFSSPQLNLSKRADLLAPVPGSQLSYTLSYSNSNPSSPALNVRLYDFLPLGVQYVASSPPATFYLNGMLLFIIPSVGQQTEDVTIQVRVPEGYSQLANYALVAADGAVPATASLVTTVSNPWGRLRLSKEGPAAALVNSQMVYVVTSQNPGTTGVTDVSLADVLPANVSFVGASLAPDTQTAPLLHWSLGDLGPGESRTVVVTTTAPLIPGIITNTVIADGPQLTMMTALRSTQVVTQGPILRIANEGSAPQVNVGDMLIYTLRYSNVGNQPAAGVVLTDTLPAGITLLTADPPWTTMTSQWAKWQLGSLVAGASGQVVITTTVNGPGKRLLTNVADITESTSGFSEHTHLETFVRPFILYLPLVSIPDTF